MGTRRAAVVGALVAAAVALILSVAPAGAHAALKAAYPGPNQRLMSSPTRVTLAFDDKVTLVPDAVKVLSASGTRVDSADQALVSGGTTVAESVRADLPDGSYRVHWRVMSDDGHLVSGDVPFTVARPGPAPPPKPATANPTTATNAPTVPVRAVAPARSKEPRRSSFIPVLVVAAIVAAGATAVTAILSGRRGVRST